MPGKVPILPILPNIDDKKLKRYLLDFHMAVLAYMNQQTKMITSTVYLTGRIVLPFADNIGTNSAVEREFKNMFANDIKVKRISVDFLSASSGAATISLRNASSGAGDGISLTLASPYKTGNNTGDVTILAGGSIYLRFTNALNLGNGIITVDYI